MYSIIINVSSLFVYGDVIGVRNLVVVVSVKISLHLRAAVFLIE